MARVIDGIGIMSISEFAEWAGYKESSVRNNFKWVKARLEERGFKIIKDGRGDHAVVYVEEYEDKDDILYDRFLELKANM